jgi:hypothetical protein
MKVMKVVCRECGWHGLNTDALVAQNPFDTNDTIQGCPSCSSAECLRMACDEPNCLQPVSCGTPTKDGYRHTCSAHRPLAPGERR